MEKQRSIKVLSVVALIIAVLGLTVAFAAMNQVLNITGTGSVKGNTQTDGDGKETKYWDVHFDNLLGRPSGLAKVVTAPVLNTEGTSIGDFEVSLALPGDKIVYTFDVVNDGQVEVKLTDIKGLNPVCTGTATKPEDKTADENQVCHKDHLTYTLTYTDSGDDVKVNDILDIDETKNLTLTLAYDYDGDRKIINDVEISGLDIELIYSQN